MESLKPAPIVQEKISDRQYVGGNNQVIKEREREECGGAKLNDDRRHSKSGDYDQSQENKPKNVFSFLQSSDPFFEDSYSMKFLNVIFLPVFS